MKVVAILILTLFCTGCTVARIGDFHVMLLCKKELLERDGMSVHVEEDNLHHNKCNAQLPLQFTYNLK